MINITIQTFYLLENLWFKVENIMSIASILIPMYNREKFIFETIRSAQMQTISDIEIIVVDNCSSDNSYNIVKEMSEKDNRIKLYKNEINLGAVINWIKCVEYANSPYSKILFSDDLIRENFLEKTLPSIINSKCAFAYTPGIVGSSPWSGGIHYRILDGDSKINKDYFVRIGTYTDNIICPSPACALFRTSDLMKNIHSSLPGVQNYDFNKYGAGVDWLISMLTALKYDYVAYIDEPLVFFRAHGESISIINENNMVAIGTKLAKDWLKLAVKGL